MGDNRRTSDSTHKKKKKKSASGTHNSSGSRSNTGAKKRTSSQKRSSSSAKRSNSSQARSTSTKRSNSSAPARSSSAKKRPAQRPPKRRRLRISALIMRILFLLVVVLGIAYGVNAVSARFFATRDAAPAGEESSGVAETESSAEETESVEETEESTEEESSSIEESSETAETVQAAMGASTFHMIFAGDVWLGEIAPSYDEKGIDGILSEDLLQTMQNANLTMINEEFPFGNGGTAAPDKQNTFQVAPSYVSAFKEMGVDVVSLANNHVLDYGKSVLTQTFKTLDGAGIDYVGAGDTEDRAMQWQSYELGGKKVAVLSASRILPTADWNVEITQPGVFSTYNSKKLKKQIAAAKEENDIVVVYLHWGIEKNLTPEDYQKELAHELVDAGADLIVGSHPHVLQGIEYYNNTPIVYSLGNLMFHEGIESTALLRVDVDKWNNMNLTLIPAYAENFKTQMAKDDQAKEILKSIQDVSVNVSVTDDGRVVVR